MLVGPDGKPVAGAMVVLHGRGKFTATTDAAGKFRFENAPPSGSGYDIDARYGNLILDRTSVQLVPGPKPGGGLTAPFA